MRIQIGGYLTACPSFQMYQGYCAYPSANKANITTASFVLDIVKHGIKLDFCNQTICPNYTPCYSLTAEGAKSVDTEIKLLLLKHVISPSEIES